MAVLSDYVSGTITLTNGEAGFTGTGTGWLSAGFREGDVIFDVPGATEFMGVIADITGEAAGVLTQPWEGPDLTGVAYRMRYMSDGSRVSAMARQLVEQLGNGNLQAFAALLGANGAIPIFNGPGSMELLTKQDLVSGAAYDIQVPNLAARAAYDGQPGPTPERGGYAVLVADTGDGRSAIYSKNSDTSGDWSAPAYVTGGVGPMPTIEAGTTTTLAPGSNATFTVNPVTGGYELSAGIPAGRGQTPRGTYNPATAYVLDDAVLDNGSTWIALQATTGNAPPVLPTTSNAYWQLLARKGTDGTGTGDVVGPADAADNAFAVFADTTGKLLKTISAAAYTALLNAFVGDSGSGGTKGLVPAPVSGDASAGKFLKADGSWSIPPNPAVPTVTSWVAYTPIFTSLGTVTDISMWWRRIGDTLYVQGYFQTGTPVASQVRVSLPTGLTCDATKIPAGMVKGAWVRNAAVAPFFCLAIGGQSYFLVISPTAAGQAALTGAAIGATEYQTVDFSCAIQGW